MSAKDTVNLIAAGLKLGLTAYESARRLSDAGHTVPNLTEFERRISQLRYGGYLPKNHPDDQGGNGGQGSESGVGIEIMRGVEHSSRMHTGFGGELRCSAFSAEGHA